MRSGTLAPPLCAGIGEACAIAQNEMAAEAERIGSLRDRMCTAITERLPTVYVNGDMERRLPGNLNLSFAGVDGESLLAAFGDLAVSSCSACTSASVEPSYVLRAIGVADELADASIRFGFGRFTTGAEVDYAAATVVEQVRHLRAASGWRETA